MSSPLAPPSSSLVSCPASPPMSPAASLAGPAIPWPVKWHAILPSEFKSSNYQDSRLSGITTSFKQRLKLQRDSTPQPPPQIKTRQHLKLQRDSTTTSFCKLSDLNLPQLWLDLPVVLKQNSRTARDLLLPPKLTLVIILASAHAALARTPLAHLRIVVDDPVRDESETNAVLPFRPLAPGSTLRAAFFISSAQQPVPSWLSCRGRETGRIRTRSATFIIAIALGSPKHCAAAEHDEPVDDVEETRGCDVGDGAASPGFPGCVTGSSQLRPNTSKNSSLHPGPPSPAKHSSRPPPLQVWSRLLGRPSSLKEVHATFDQERSMEDATPILKTQSSGTPESVGAVEPGVPPSYSSIMPTHAQESQAATPTMGLLTVWKRRASDVRILVVNPRSPLVHSLHHLARLRRARIHIRATAALPPALAPFSSQSPPVSS
ncbi:hypothetical protein C8R46DRAFT_1359786 [Mycena filopes]|nr:hypothetical protein C8R46DRAFT_1359786 [Mycena filopes]